MLNQTIKNVINIWPKVTSIVYVPYTEEQYDALVSLLDTLIDEVGEDETHPLSTLMDLVGTLIEHYENKHIPEPTQLD
jgi:HTH-type transcriptional regulator/antitoxin HigA